MESDNRPQASIDGPEPDYFALPERLASKGKPGAVERDRLHFAAIAGALQQSIADLTDRLATERRAPGGARQAALDRDLEIHRLSGRLHALGRFGVDLCLGRVLFQDDDEPPLYIGRLGLNGADGQRLLVDWRSKAAEPFFGATHANPMGLLSRRRYRWTRGRVTDYWDEVFTDEGLEGNAALDDQSAFIATLGAARSPQMRDVLGTIQSDQDAIVRASAAGALVVDGGPGTGKTVVALHRTAYLLYADPMLNSRRGNALFVGPHQPYLTYVADVLPSLGEDGVQTCTLRDLVPEGMSAVAEPRPETAGLKTSRDMVLAVETAVRFYEDPPTQTMRVSTPYGQVRLTAADWADAFAAADPAKSHNEARQDVWDELLTVLVDAHDLDDEDDVSPADVRAALQDDGALAASFNRSWPVLDPVDVVADLWSVPAFLRHCAPWLTPDQAGELQRDDPYSWSISDLPLLDAARRRIGAPDLPRKQQQARAADAAERRRMTDVIDRLIEADDGEGLVTQLRHTDLQDALVDQDTLPAEAVDRLAGPFAHIVVDEAQELTDAEWQMLLARCPSRSFTIVGDRAQARQGFPESWQARLTRAGLNRVSVSSLTINYRTPAEVMSEAEPLIRAALPDANVPTSIRSSGVPVLHASHQDRDAIVRSWLAEHDDGIACVIGDDTLPDTPRVRSLSPALSKGLEFDLVVLVRPDDFGQDTAAAVDRYVAMTRTTRQLVVLT